MTNVKETTVEIPAIESKTLQLRLESELDSFAKKYSTLRELSKVFDAIAEINAK